MKGNLLRYSKKSVTLGIMAATIAFSLADGFQVLAESEVSGGDSAYTAEESQNFGGDLSGITDDSAQLPEQDNFANSADKEDAQDISEKDDGEASFSEKNEEASSVESLTATGTPINPLVYDGSSHAVQIELTTTAITIDGNAITAAVVTDANGKPFYIVGLPDNKVTVLATDATNDNNNSFEADLTGTSVYDSSFAKVNTPGTITVVADGVILKKTVRLSSMNIVKTYDGTPLTNAGMPLALEEGWIPGQGAYYSFTKSRTAIGTDVNEFVISSYIEGTNPDNYEVEYTFGALSVVDRTESQKYILTVEGLENTFKYDGTTRNISGFILEGRSDAEFQVNGNGDPSQVLTFTIGNAVFTVTGISATGSGVNAGEYSVNISGSPVIKDAEGNVVTGQFKFEFSPGKLIIEKRKVILTSASLTKKFDNKTHKKHKVTVSGDGFAEGEGATYEFTGKQKAVGESYNYFSYKLNEGTLEENYDIEKIPGILKVTKEDKAINVMPDEDSSNTSSESGESSSQTEASESAKPADDSAEGSGEGASAKAETLENATVLGARRDGGEVTVDIAHPINENVLGARRSSTDDYSDIGRHIVVFAVACAFMTLITMRRNKRKKND
ncbi:hypothetical protein [Butyrivibrio sp. JL13D10]|uniref:hypothetical protein n=1 Tax=Butyrivibrio sp. JL13D10 TaxID=3236815 RepID=UPI0038B5F374